MSIIEYGKTCDWKLLSVDGWTRGQESMYWADVIEFGGWMEKY